MEVAAVPQRLLERAEAVLRERNGRVLALFRFHQFYVIKLGEAVVSTAIHPQSISLSKQVHDSVFAFAFMESVNVRLAHHVLAQVFFEKAVVNRLLYDWIFVFLAEKR